MRSPRRKPKPNYMALTFPLPDGSSFTITACPICYGNTLEHNMQKHMEWHYKTLKSVGIEGEFFNESD